MNKTLKKLLAIGLSVILIISLIPASVLTALAFDSVEEFADSPAITLDTETDVSYDGNEVSGTFKFTPAADGIYLLYSSGNTDTYAQIVDANGYTIATDDDSGSNSNFKVKFSAQAGATYYLITHPYYPSNTAEYSVTLMEYDNPIERVEIAPIQVIKDFSGSVYTDSDDQEYFHYDYNSPTYTVYFKDGSSPRSSSYGMSIDGQYFYLEYEDDQETNHWDDYGDYVVNFTFAGYSSTFTVSIVENPVDRIEIDDVTVIKEQGGYSSYDYSTGENYYRYNYTNPKYTVYYKDGTQSETNNNDKKVYDSYYSLNKNDNQSGEHWTVGNTYTVPCTFAGVSASFNVNVVETPVTSVVIDDLVLTENINGYETTDSNGTKYFYYNLGNTPEYTVYYDDTQTEKNRYSKDIYN
ncbi:MAG: hypothetical protein J5662_00445 [Clostridia bacterium]|nr:hypothetical protein [Clostridia bacterium]